MENYMLKFIKIRNSYGRRIIGELSINEQALLEYEKFCLDLIKENEKQKEVIDKAIEYIEKEYYSKNTVDIESMGITTNKLLQVRNLLKEVSE